MGTAIKYLIILLVASVPIVSVVCQCTDRDSLWKRLVFLRDSSTASPGEQLIELKKYLADADKCSFGNDSLGAFLLQRIGAAYLKMADFPQAEKYTRAAVNIVQSNRGKPVVNEGHLVKYYYALSVIYNSSNNPYRKSQSEDSCIAIAMRTRTTDGYLLKAIYERAASLYESGDFHRCIQYTVEGESIASSLLHGTDSLRYAYSFLLWKVNALYYLNEFSEAELILRKKISEYQKLNDKTYSSFLYERIAAIKTQKREFHDAIYYFEKSLDIDFRNKSYVNCSQTLVNMGYYLYNVQLHNYDSALYCFKKALEFFSIPHAGDQFDSSELKSQKLLIYGNMANAYTALNEFDSAKLYFKIAYTQVDLDLGKDDPSNSPKYDWVQGKIAVYILNTIIDEADGQLRKYHILKDISSLRNAARLYNISDKLQRQINSQQLELQSRLFWRNNLKRLYEHAIETHYLLEESNAAFYYFEKSRSALLIDNLNNQNTLHKNELFKLAQVKQKITRITAALNSPSNSSSRITDAQNILFNYNVELRELEESIRKSNPLYYHSLFDTSNINISDVKSQILTDHHVLFEVFEGDSSIYTILITKNKTVFNRIDKEEFDKSSTLYYSLISDVNLLNRRFDDFVRVSNHLFKLLFKDDFVPEGRIIISPDGKYFPFESLVTRFNSGQPIYFLEKYAISYTYSAKYLLNEFSDTSTATTGYFLGVAPVQYPTVFNLTPLSQSDVSLGNISSMISHSKSLVASNATKANFMQQFYNYKIIQLYTHASDSSNNGEPVIYFSDSVLYLSELIPENKPATRLIVLSACETGNGKLYKGEGVFSFNRGFAAMGIPSSVTNLWSVDNESTYKITELFYEYVEKGLPLDIALQKAKLDFIRNSSKEKRLPYYWAAAILVGKTDIVEVNSHFSWKWFSFAAILLFASLAFFIIRRRKFHIHDS